MRLQSIIAPLLLIPIAVIATPIPQSQISAQASQPESITSDTLLQGLPVIGPLLNGLLGNVPIVGNILLKAKRQESNPTSNDPVIGDIEAMINHLPQALKDATLGATNAVKELGGGLNVKRQAPTPNPPANFDFEHYIKDDVTDFPKDFSDVYQALAGTLEQVDDDGVVGDVVSTVIGGNDKRKLSTLALLPLEQSTEDLAAQLPQVFSDADQIFKNGGSVTEIF